MADSSGKIIFSNAQKCDKPLIFVDFVFVFVLVLFGRQFVASCSCLQFIQWDTVLPERTTNFLNGQKQFLPSCKWRRTLISSWFSLNSLSSLPTFEWIKLSLSVSVCLVFNLQLRTGPHLLLSVPEDKLRAEDDYHVDSCCGLQHHYSTNTCLSAGWI